MKYLYSVLFVLVSFSAIYTLMGYDLGFRTQRFKTGDCVEGTELIGSEDSLTTTVKGRLTSNGKSTYLFQIYNADTNSFGGEFELSAGFVDNHYDKVTCMEDMD
jgi:hypothetical protein